MLASRDVYRRRHHAAASVDSTDSAITPSSAASTAGRLPSSSRARAAPPLVGPRDGRGGHRSPRQPGAITTRKPEAGALALEARRARAARRLAARSSRHWLNYRHEADRCCRPAQCAGPQLPLPDLRSSSTRTGLASETRGRSSQDCRDRSASFDELAAAVRALRRPTRARVTRPARTDPAARRVRREEREARRAARVRRQACPTCSSRSNPPAETPDVWSGDGGRYIRVLPASAHCRCSAPARRRDGQPTSTTRWRSASQRWSSGCPTTFAFVEAGAMLGAGPAVEIREALASSV